MYLLKNARGCTEDTEYIFRCDDTKYYTQNESLSILDMLNEYDLSYRTVISEDIYISIYYENDRFMCCVGLIDNALIVYSVSNEMYVKIIEEALADQVYTNISYIISFLYIIHNSFMRTPSCEVVKSREDGKDFLNNIHVLIGYNLYKQNNNTWMQRICINTLKSNTSSLVLHNAVNHQKNVFNNQLSQLTDDINNINLYDGHSISRL